MKDELAAEWARFFYNAGYNPLPSANKIPAFRGGYGHIRDKGILPNVLETFWTPALQLCTGSRWGLVVVDLDGVMGRDWWMRQPANSPTWTVRTRRGYHLWFSVPRGGPEIPHKTVLWELSGAKHQAVEVLGDRNLVVAPPSPIDQDSGRRYAFLPGLSPHEIRRPAPLPDWVSRSLAAPAPVLAPRPLTIPSSRPALLSLGHAARQEVLDAIPDKSVIAESWGLRFRCLSPNAAGWYKCHAYNRDDDNPSASFSINGVYQDRRDGISLGLFDLAVELGVHASWQDACNSLGQQFGVGSSWSGSCRTGRISLPA